MKKRLLFLLPFLLLSFSACKKNNTPSEPISESETAIVSESRESESEPFSYDDSSEESESESESESEDYSESEQQSESESEQTSESETTPTYDEKGLEGDPIRTDPVAQKYYENISADLTGDSLGRALSTLVNKNRCSTGYSSLWSYYPYCDADPDNPSSDKIIAFYRGTPSTQSAMNKEHVWPDSRGGNLVEGDPHMTRPTLKADNSSRGNSFYVENMCSQSNGWDPKADGMNENYRGDSARIIFYAAVVKYGTLKLVDKTTDSTGNQSMGKLYDLIKWNFEYPISKYEKLRNEVLSGERSVKNSDYKFNRNPFIDDRSLPCKIWGNTNSNIKALCDMYTKKTPPTSIILSDSVISLAMMGTHQLSVKSVTPVDAVKTVTWSSSNDNVASVSSSGLVTANMDGEAIITATSTLDTNVKATCKVIVKTEDKELEGITVTSTLNLSKGSSGQINVTLNPTNTYPRPTLEFSSNNTGIATVSSTGLVTAKEVGNAEITVTATQGSVKKYGYCQVNVTQVNTFNKVTSTLSNWAGKYLIVCEGSNKAFKSSASNIDSTENAIDVIINNSKITVNNDLMSALVVVEQIGSEYIMKTSTGLVLSNSDKSFKAEESGATRAKISISNGELTLTFGSGSKKLMYNKSWGGFRFYASGQSAVQLYRLG